MNPTLRNVLAVLAGVLLGGALNGGIVAVSGSIIPPPEGANLTTVEGLKASMHLMQPKHFVMPFLAHASGTLLGAYVACRLAPNGSTRPGWIVGVLFLTGGIANVLMLPSPLWFSVLDLVVAYIPMAYIATKIATQKA